MENPSRQDEIAYCANVRQLQLIADELLDILCNLLLQIKMISKLWRIMSAFLMLWLLSVNVAKAQLMTEITTVPDDCRSALPMDKRGTLQNWKVFVKLEHCDRIKRLKRLSELLPPQERPIFYEGIISSSQLPTEFGVDIPILRVIFPDGAFFDTARSKMRPEADKIVDIVAQSLRKEPPDVALFIAGHADKRGGQDYNEALSIDRANSIAEEIYLKGINFSSIWRIGFGEDMPLNIEENEMAHSINRRVEFLFAAKPTALAVWLSIQQLDQICSARNRKEAELCKAGLNLKDGYEVVEIKLRPKRTVVIKPHSKLGTKANIAKNKVKDVDLAKNERDKVEPVGARRFRIEPRNRRVAPVSLEL